MHILQVIHILQVMQGIHCIYPTSHAGQVYHAYPTSNAHPTGHAGLVMHILQVM